MPSSVSARSASSAGMRLRRLTPNSASPSSWAPSVLMQISPLTRSRMRDREVEGQVPSQECPIAQACSSPKWSRTAIASSTCVSTV